jgi:hypothetical protein
MDGLELLTAGNDGTNLTIALNYGGRDEVTRAARRLAHDVAAGKLNPREIGDETLPRYLDTYVLPDPDLVIRTSGEARISNFLLWQSAYSEYEFIDTLWPDFTPRSSSACWTASAIANVASAPSRSEGRHGAGARQFLRPFHPYPDRSGHRRGGPGAVWAGYPWFTLLVAAIIGVLVWELATMLVRRTPRVGLGAAGRDASPAGEASALGLGLPLLFLTGLRRARSCRATGRSFLS